MKQPTAMANPERYIILRATKKPFLPKNGCLAWGIQDCLGYICMLPTNDLPKLILFLYRFAQETLVGARFGSMDAQNSGCACLPTSALSYHIFPKFREIYGSPRAGPSWIKKNAAAMPQPGWPKFDRVSAPEVEHGLVRPMRYVENRVSAQSALVGNGLISTSTVSTLFFSKLIGASTLGVGDR